MNLISVSASDLFDQRYEFARLVYHSNNIRSLYRTQRMEGCLWVKRFDHLLKCWVGFLLVRFQCVSIYLGLVGGSISASAAKTACNARVAVLILKCFFPLTPEEYTYFSHVVWIDLTLLLSVSAKESRSIYQAHVNDAFSYCHSNKKFTSRPLVMVNGDV